MRKLSSATRRAIADYNMISDGDKIAVGISGGKDSLALLAVLASMRKYLDKKFEICAITIDMGFPGTSTDEIAEYCKSLDVEYIIHKTDFAEIIFNIRKEKNPCSLCAKMRRGALNDIAVQNGCRKIALGHHADDVIETFFLSLFYEARINCFSPVTYLDRMDVTVIRPFLYVDEKDIKGFAARENLPVMKSKCPADGNTKRESIKQLLKGLEKENHDLRSRIFRAVKAGLFDAVSE